LLLKGKMVIVTGVAPRMEMQLCRIAACEGAAVVVSACSEGFVREVGGDCARRAIA
jgi:hypothetical protein